MIIREFGGPDVLRWEDVPTPGPEEVVVRVHAVSVNRTLDLQVRQDGGGYGTVLSLVLGNDPSGVVVTVGQGVEQLHIDQRVAVFGGIRCGTCTAASLQAAGWSPPGPMAAEDMCLWTSSGCTSVACTS
jgi:NADPH:quinone reductase-like Zn-dependent oxidoreductase